MSTDVGSRGRSSGGFVLVVAGVVILGLVVLAPVVGWLAGLASGQANFDILLPFELFPVTILAAALLATGSLLLRRGRAWVWGLIAGAVAITAAGLLWASSSGIATETDLAETDWRLVVALGLFGAGYAILVALAVAGAWLLVTELRSRRPG